MDLESFIKKYGVEEINKFLIEYFIIVMAKAKKYDEVADALESNGCNLALVRKIMESDVYDE